MASNLSDDYPVYNHSHRPGIGRDQLGCLYYNCFSVHLERDVDSSGYLPFTFSDFIKCYNQYPEYSGTCESCISEHKILSFPFNDVEVDRSAVDRKFSYYKDESDYYHCPLIREVLLASELKVEPINCCDRENLPAEPIRAILWHNWDDDYLFDFQELGIPRNLRICRIYRNITSPQFVSAGAECDFLRMWFVSMFHCIEIIRRSGQNIYLEEVDFYQSQSKIFSFLFPLPQVWVRVIPKAPPGVDWRRWEQQQREADREPQRVDFLFTYRGTRHVVELDGVGHYGKQGSGGVWVASEAQYRRTLLGSRFLRGSGFEVHRFTNEEVLELSRRRDTQGFIELLRLEGLEPIDMVLLR